jgi:hypothetical protein
VSARSRSKNLADIELVAKENRTADKTEFEHGLELLASTLVSQIGLGGVS